MIERLHSELGQPVTCEEILAAPRLARGEPREQGVERAGGVIIRRRKAREVVDPESGRAKQVDGFEPVEGADQLLRGLVPAIYA